MGACTVTHVLTPATAGPDEYAAALHIVGAALAALAVVWAVRRLIAFFDRSTDA